MGLGQALDYNIHTYFLMKTETNALRYGVAQRGEEKIQGRKGIKMQLNVIPLVDLDRTVQQFRKTDLS